MVGDEVSADDCIHGLPSFACSICLGRPPTPASRSFPAKFQGWCRGCSEVIMAGDLIVAKGGEYFHEDCA